ncbi:uncharacterized protein [Henckelia pumila]|uniref:uncharacterized protein n=1 Tax=Henckelia pumila TaxID=405737 RepID=UPI003C6DC089
MATNANLSLRQLGTPDLNQQPLCITFPTLEANATFELKSELIHLLPAFHGLAGEDPHKHLMEFHVVHMSMQPHGVTEEQIQLRAFPFSLKNAAKDWLYYLPPGSITTWIEMKRIFLEKYFSASRAANIRKEIYGIKQYTGESLHEYWERFKKLCASCPQHQISENILIQYFYEGNGQTMKGCGICNAMGHATEMCPTLQEELVEHVNATGGFPGPPQRKYDPYSKTYNPSWKDHPNPRYGKPSVNQPAPHVQQNNQAYRPPYPPQPQRLKFQRLTVVNPKENVSAITLRSGKKLKVNEEVVKKPVQNNNEKESKVEEDETIQEAPRGKFPPFSEYKPVAPFPFALKESRKDEGIKGLYEVFRRCERKQKLKGCQKVELGEQVCAVIQRKVPTKCKDPDLGASINVMPYSVYVSLNLGPLTETAIVIQMADRSTIYPSIDVAKDPNVNVMALYDMIKSTEKDIWEGNPHRHTLLSVLARKLLCNQETHQGFGTLGRED